MFDLTKSAAILASNSNIKLVRQLDDGSFVALDENEQEVAWDDEAVTTKQAELQSAEDMTKLRDERNRLLAATDHWAMSDTPDMTTEQTNYRQALRDITNSATSLDDVTWPTKP